MSFTARLSQDLLAVEPGATSPLSFEVANRSEEADRFEVEIEGLDPEWTAIPVPTFKVDPGEVQTEKVFFKPPRASESVSGNYPFVLKVRSLNSGEQRTVQGVLQIKQYHHLSMEVSPKKGYFTSTKKANVFSITLMNLGNTDHTVQLYGNDPEDACAFEFESDQVSLSPGQQKTLIVEVVPTNVSLVSSGKLFGFTLSARSIETPAVTATAQAQLETKALLNPGFIGFLAVLAVVIGLWIYFLPKKPTMTLTVNPPTSMVGEKVTIKYAALNADAVDITVNGQSLVARGSTTSSELTYDIDKKEDLEIIGIPYRGSVQGEPVKQTVTVGEVEGPKILSFTASPMKVNKGEVITFKWKVANTEKLNLLPSGQDLEPNLEQIQIPATTTGRIVYRLVAQNAAGVKVEETLKITVGEVSAAKILLFNASPTKLMEGGGMVKIDWSVSNAKLITLKVGDGAEEPLREGDSPKEILVTKTSTLVLTGTDVNGLTISKTVKVVVEEPPPPIEEVPPITVSPPPDSGGGR